MKKQKNRKPSALTALSLTFLLAALAPGESNAASVFSQNFDANTDLENWGQTTVTSGNGMNSSRAARIGTGSGGFGINIRSHLAPETAYKFTSFSRAGSASNAGTVGVKAIASNGKILFDKTVWVGATSYSQNSIDFSVPAETQVVYIYAWKNSGNDYFYADNFEVTNGSSSPTPSPTPAPDRLVKAVNMNGPALAVDGVSFEAMSTSGLTHNGQAFENQSVTLNPATDSTRARLIRSSIWNGSNLRVRVPNLTAAKYKVFLYTWEDNAPSSFALTVESLNVGTLNSGSAGNWKRLGPYQVDVTDGALDVVSSNGDFNLSALEIYRTGDVAPPTPSPSPTPAPSPTPPPSIAIPSELNYGVNMSSLQAGWEGDQNEYLPGRLGGSVFITPESHYAYYASKGMTHIRLEGLWERLQPRLYGSLGEQLLDHYNSPNDPLRNPVNIVRHYLDLAQKYNMKVILDLNHNYGHRYVGYNGSWSGKRKAQLGSTDVPVTAFVDYSVKVIQAFGNHPAVAAIELMNEPHDLAIGTNGWKDACQQAINGIRNVNSSVLIYVDGYSWASAMQWKDVNPTLHQLYDPSNRLIFTAHQYFDNTGAGLYKDAEALSPSHNNLDLGAQRIQPFIDWVKQYNLQGRASLSEFGAPNTAKWAEIVRRMMVKAKAEGLMLTPHEDVPYANDPYIMNLFPRSGEGDQYVMRLMESAKRGTSYLNSPLSN